MSGLRRRKHLTVLYKSLRLLCAVLMWLDMALKDLTGSTKEREQKKASVRKRRRARGHISWHGWSGSQLPWSNLDLSMDPHSLHLPPTHPHTPTHTHLLLHFPAWCFKCSATMVVLSKPLNDSYGMFWFELIIFCFLCIKKLFKGHTMIMNTDIKKLISTDMVKVSKTLAGAWFFLFMWE